VCERYEDEAACAGRHGRIEQVEIPAVIHVFPGDASDRTRKTDSRDNDLGAFDDACE
jgi:hypothetical protein